MDKEIFFIGIMEESKDRNILKYTKELLSLSNYKIIYSNITGDINGFSNDKIILIIFDFVPKDIKELNLWNLQFDIIVHSSMVFDGNEYTNYLFKICKYCIINSDDETSITIMKKIKDGIAITYGFNNKSSLTISSHIINQGTEVNICLQRNITPIKGSKIEPFEFFIEIDSTDNKLIYPLLAAAALNLAIGNVIFSDKCNSTIKLNL